MIDALSSRYRALTLLLFVFPLLVSAGTGDGSSGGVSSAPGRQAFRLGAGLPSPATSSAALAGRLHAQNLPGELRGAAAFIGSRQEGPTRTRVISGPAGKPAEVVEEMWNDALQEWVNGRRSLYTYTLTGNVLEIVTAYWVTSAWVNLYRNRYVYDEDDYLIEEYEDDWDGAVWVAAFMLTYVNDANGRALTAVYRHWLAAAWVNLYRWTYAYDGAGNLTEEQWEAWDGNDWVNYIRLLYSYNVLLLTSFEYQTWAGTAWSPVLRSLLTYDLSDFLALIMVQSWTGSAWNDDRRYSYTYDKSGRRIEELGEFKSGAVWINESRISTSYDAGDNVTEVLEQEWGGTDWVNLNIVRNTYNLAAAPAGYAVAGAGGVTLADLLQSVKQIWADTVWINFTRISYTYGPGTAVGDRGDLPGRYRLGANYPNPFNPATTLTYELPERSFVRMTILDVMGREVASLVEGEKPAGAHEIRWDAGGRPTGVYYCRMQAGDFEQTRKLLLMR